MESRIRYQKTNKKGIIVSVRDLISRTTGAKYRVKIDTNTCTYKIINIGSERCYTGPEDINNLNVLKRHVKSHLQRLGVRFSREIRDNTSRVRGLNCSYTKEDLEKLNAGS